MAVSLDEILKSMEERVRILRNEPAESIDIFPTVRILREQARLIAALRKAIEQRRVMTNGGGWEGFDALNNKYNEEIASILSGSDGTSAASILRGTP